MSDSYRPIMKRVSILILLVSVAALFWFSFRLAGIRIYQVDECQNVFTARILATGQSGNSFTGITLFLLPLVWLGRNITTSVELFVAARFFSFELFWLNIVLLALATGEKLFSRRGLVALIGAATLAPLWDYGFEIRHDNLLLSGLLLMWCVVRVRPEGLQSYFIAGALAVGLEFVAFKAFVYVVPIALAVLIFPPPGYKAPRWKLALAWIAGAVGAFLLVRIAYGMAGLWDVYLGGVRTLLQNASGGIRFAPWDTLSRLLTQDPLLLVFVTSGLIAMACDLRRRGRAALIWDGNLPEALLFAVALAALLINPAPYPYDLLHLVPYAFLFAFRYASALVNSISDRPALVPVIGAVVIFTHLLPFGIATRRHLKMSNYHQEGLMCLAESLTDPVKDPVYDGVGMVPTRRSIHYQWFLHSLNIRNFVAGPGLRVRDMLAARPAAVIIPNYRTDWLPEEDHDFIRGHYVPLADDFWVLGKVLSPGGGTFAIGHAGRYRISSLQGSDIMGTFPAGLQGLTTPENDGNLEGTLDGKPLSAGVVELTVGEHRIATATDCQPAVVWMGPRVDRIHRMSQSDHRLLFFNWY